MSYASRADVFNFGVPRGTVLADGRVGVASATSDAVELEGHGLETGSVVTVRATEGSVLPPPLTPDATYYAIRVDDARFQLAASSADATAGTEIDLTSSGGEFVVTTPLPWAEVLEWADRMVDSMIPAHAVPLPDPAPSTVKMVAARLAGAELQRLSGVKSVAMSEALADARTQLAEWAKGVPVRAVVSTHGRTNLAISSTLTGTAGRDEIP